MDCRTARSLFAYHRAGAPELDAADRQLLEAHLAGCPECDGLARAERHVDGHLGKAMREVPIPANLRKRLLTQLAANREEWYRRWLAHGMRVAAVAALVLVGVFVGLSWKQQSLPKLDTDSIKQEAQITSSPPLADDAANWFAKRGETVVLPERFNYSYLATYSLSDFAGKPVPLLHFNHKETFALAYVYILSGERFDLSSVQDDTTSEDGYYYKVEIWKENGFVYVIRYAGELSKLLRPPVKS